MIMSLNLPTTFGRPKDTPSYPWLIQVPSNHTLNTPTSHQPTIQQLLCMINFKLYYYYPGVGWGWVGRNNQD